MILLLILASGLVGIVLARFFRVYAVIPAMLFVIVPAYFLGQHLGLSFGLMAFAAGAVVMQICYFAGKVAFVLKDNFSIEKAPSESSIFLSL